MEMNRILRGQEGQSLPLVVMFLLVLMGALALVLDGGNGYFQRRHAQNAADAAALAAATTIIKGEYRDLTVQQVVTSFAQQNGAATATLEYLDVDGNVLTPSDGNVPAATASVRVTAQRTFPTSFAAVLGMSTMTASAQSTARAEQAAAVTEDTGLAPLTVPINFEEACYRPTDSCDIWDAQFAKAWGIKGADYKTLIDLSLGTAVGATTQNVSNWTLYGYPGVVDVNTWIPTISGNYGNNVANSLRLRFTMHPGGVDPDGVVWGTIDIVVWDGYQNDSIHVAKFGRFKVRMTDVSGSHTYGHFVNYIVSGHARSSTLTYLPGPVIITLGQ
jgi:Flp pilus assembly protein TadG